MSDETVQVQNPATIKKLEKQCLLTEEGIEISIPMELYNRKDKVEFTVNPDGSLSVTLKDIQKISQY